MCPPPPPPPCTSYRHCWDTGNGPSCSGVQWTVTGTKPVPIPPRPLPPVTCVSRAWWGIASPVTKRVASLVLPDVQCGASVGPSPEEKTQDQHRDQREGDAGELLPQVREAQSPGNLPDRRGPQPGQRCTLGRVCRVGAQTARCLSTCIRPVQYWELWESGKGW